tara:strand:- start:327 stop:1334 length:1008 start_codon:yes stop_codon:yes gene_type:complete
MANWKKIIVSGSSAVLGGVSLPSLTTNNLVKVGGSGVLSDSGITINGGTLAIGTNVIRSTGATSILSGSFSGSFQGDGSLLTGIATSLDISGSSGNTSIDLKTEDFTIDAGNSISTAATSNTITVAVTDGGITETQLNASVAGTGLSGGAGSALSVDYGSSAGTAVQGDTTITINGTSGEIGVTGTAAQALGGGPSYTLTLPDTISGNRTFSNNVVITGDLTVNGSTTTVSTTNLEVEDKFLFLNAGSGSASPVGEGGIIVEAGTADSGSAFYYDGNSARWSLADDIKKDATSVTPEAFTAVVVDVAGGQADAAKYRKNGNIKVNSSGDIFIYVE